MGASGDEHRGGPESDQASRGTSAPRPEAPPHTEDGLATGSLSAGSESPDQAEPPPPKMGERIGRFEIERVLGHGGFGLVLAARDTDLGRDVALKVLRLGFDDGVGSTPFASAFRREAEAIARLNHPNIVALYDFGRWRGRPYLVLELLEGETLQSHMRRLGALSPERALDIAREVVRALAYAHARGVVHRDLKPANVMMVRGGPLKVLDFGLARVSEAVHAMRDGASEAMRAPSEGRTLAGAGTPGYMAPEQWRREAQGPAADVFAAGVILYELLTGARPFASPGGPRHAQPLTGAPQRTGGPFAPRRALIAARVPEALADVVVRALHEEPGARFADGQALLDALEALPVVAPRRRRRALVWSAAALSALVVTVWLASSSRLPTPGAPAAPPRERALRQRQLTFDGDAVLPALSGDGALVAYVSGGRVHLRATDGDGETWTLPGAREVSRLLWARRAARLAYSAREGDGVATFIRDLDLNKRIGRAPRRLVDVPWPLTLSPRGRRVCFVRQRGVRRPHLVVRVLRDGAERVHTLPFESPYVTDLDWSPTSEAVVVLAGETGRQEVWRVPLDDRGEAHRLAAERALVHSVRWSVDGREVYALRRAAGANEIVRFDAATAREAPEPPSVVAGLSGLGQGHGLSTGGSPQRFAYERALLSHNLWRLPLPARGVAPFSARTRLTRSTAFVQRGVASPDGVWLAYTQREADMTSLFVRSLTAADGGRRVTRFDGRAGPPAWSPDGRRVALTCERGGVAHVCLVEVATGTTHALDGTRVSNDDRTVEWAPHATIAYQAPGHRRLHVVEPSTGAVVPLQPWTSRGFTFAWSRSPGGRRVALFWNRPDGRGLWLSDPSTGAARMLRPGFHDALSWSRDGRALYVAHNQPDRVRAVLRLDPQTGAATTVAEFPAEALVGPVTIGHDESYLLLTLAEGGGDVWLAEQ